LENLNEQIDFKNELLRKGIHLISVVIPLLNYFVDRDFMVYGTLAASIFMILLDIGRKTNEYVNKYYLKILNPILRHKEIDVKKHLLTGGTYYIIGIFLTILLFPKEIASTAIFVMIICDTAAAIMGKRFGNHKIFSKSLEGSLSFLLIGIIIIMVTPKVSTNTLEYISAFTALFLTTLLELFSSKVDDNIVIPISFSVIYFLLNKFILNI
jgi:dolichol kinase